MFTHVVFSFCTILASSYYFFVCSFICLFVYLFVFQADSTEFDPCDVHRVRQSVKYVEKFARHKFADFNEAYAMLVISYACAYIGNKLAVFLHCLAKT